MNDDAGRHEPRYVGFWRRAFASLVDTVLLLALLAPVAFDGRKQGWHDKLARTLVVERGR